MARRQHLSLALYERPDSKLSGAIGISRFRSCTFDLPGSFKNYQATDHPGNCPRSRSSHLSALYTETVFKAQRSNGYIQVPELYLRLIRQLSGSFKNYQRPTMSWWQVVRCVDCRLAGEHNHVICIMPYNSCVSHWPGLAKRSTHFCAPRPLAKANPHSDSFCSNSTCYRLAVRQGSLRCCVLPATPAAFLRATAPAFTVCLMPADWPLLSQHGLCIGVPGRQVAVERIIGAGCCERPNLDSGWRARGGRAENQGQNMVWNIAGVRWTHAELVTGPTSVKPSDMCEKTAKLTVSAQNLVKSQRYEKVRPTRSRGGKNRREPSPRLPDPGHLYRRLRRWQQWTVNTKPWRQP